MSASMKRALGLGWIGVFILACGRPANGPSGGGAAEGAIPVLLGAEDAEQRGDEKEAIKGYLRAAEAASKDTSPSAWVPSILAASTEGLVHRSLPAADELSQRSGLALRAPGIDVEKELVRIAEASDGPFARPFLSRAALVLATHRGDVAAAGGLRKASGCVSHAVVRGPLSPLGIVAATSQPPAFVTTAALPRWKDAQTIAERGCVLPLSAPSARAGLREVVIDVFAKDSGEAGFLLKSSAPASLWVGDRLAIRSYADGAGIVTKPARATLPKGWTRVVIRAAMLATDDTVELVAVDAHGRPLETRAPKSGEIAPGKAARLLEPSRSNASAPTNEARIAEALSALALGATRIAERDLAAIVGEKTAPPLARLAYVRAISKATDLPLVERAEKASPHLEEAAKVWPASDEVLLRRAVAAEARRGPSEARIEALSFARKQGGEGRSRVRAILGLRAALVDEARLSLSQVPASPLAYDLSLGLAARTGKDAAPFRCGKGADRASFGCYFAAIEAGNMQDATVELAFLRGLFGGSRLFLAQEARLAMASGDEARTLSVAEAMYPGERSLAVAYAAGIRAKALVQEASRAPDAPLGLAPLLTARAERAMSEFDGLADKALKDNAKDKPNASAATLVLAHAERYDVNEAGLLHFTLFDLRRVSGTQDVETGAQAGSPYFFGPQAFHVLRRRIHKKDGRVLSPDPTPGAAQSHADLSQLEAGDVVEAVYEGYGLPGDLGEVGFDTADLLPERTAVVSASIEVRLPEGMAPKLRAHPLLGKPVEKVENGRRTLTYKVANQSPRRQEEGIPRLDRPVMVTMSTLSYADVAAGLAETEAALEGASPELSKFVAQIRARAGRGALPRALLDAAVLEAKTAIRQATSSPLTDGEVSMPDRAQEYTARSFLATREGSRTWLLAAALRELGLRADVAMAEREPFSSDPGFPPHTGRYVRALLRVHLPDGPIFVDADVAGPPLPAGRLSSELRGQHALLKDGSTVVLPETESEAGDEVDLRLTLDARGDAKGQLTVLLRGRNAQELADAFERLVGTDRERALRNVVLGWVPFASVDSVQLSSSEGSWQVALRSELSVSGYAQREGKKKGKTANVWSLPGMDPVHYVIPRPYSTTLGATFAAQGARENDFAVSRPMLYHVHRKVELPAGVKVERIPGAFDLKRDLVTASRRLQVGAQEIEEDFRLSVRTGTVGREAYAGFVADLQRADSAFLADLFVLRPDAKETSK